MVTAWIFDLDGTLVQTERLKAISYARAVMDLCPDELKESMVIEAFKKVVGRSRKEVARALMEEFDLEKAARKRMTEFGVSSPWQSFVQIRLNHYEKMLEDPSIILNNQWPHNVEILRQARARNCKTALVTMSRCQQAMKVLQILDLEHEFNFIATRDDVEHGKPDPEIYELALRELGVQAEECMAIEDSPAGVRSAIAAGVQVLAVTTPFTHDALHQERLLPEEWIVDDPSMLPGMMKQLMTDHN
jgi:HAD superfamily hydrolase (TIGR01509 family)